MHDKIKNYIDKRRIEVNKEVDNRTYLQEKKQAELTDEKDGILEKKEEAYKEQQKMEAIV